MPPRTLKTEIMRHMLNLAKDMASGDLLESRKKLEEYPCVVTQLYLTTSCGLEPFRTGCGAARRMTPRTTPGAGAPTSLIVPSDGCVTRINGHEKIPTTFTTP
jgi:hypothetical protein